MTARIGAAALAGVVGPIWLGTTITALSVVDAAFMASLGWHPIEHPTMDWPSGLALGPHGAWMTAAFVGCGALLPLFAAGLRPAFGASGLVRAGSALITASGIAMLLLGFPTDPTLADGPRTWHGLLHDAAFVLLGLSLFPAMIALSGAWWHQAGWRPLALYSLATMLLSAPAFALKGALFYLFLAAMCAWFVVVAVCLWRRGHKR
jgi:hypothetical protein